MARGPTKGTVSGGAAGAVASPPTRRAPVAPRDICFEDAGQIAELLSTAEGRRVLAARVGADLMGEPSKNICAARLGVLRLLRDATEDAFKERELAAKEALAEQIARERDARAALESGVKRASADVALPAFTGGEPH